MLLTAFCSQYNITRTVHKKTSQWRIYRFPPFMVCICYQVERGWFQEWRDGLFEVCCGKVFYPQCSNCGLCSRHCALDSQTLFWAHNTHYSILLETMGSCLKVTTMDKVPCHIKWCNNVHSLIHVEQNSITFGLTVIITMMLQEMLDFWEAFFNWV